MGKRGGHISLYPELTESQPLWVSGNGWHSWYQTCRRLQSVYTILIFKHNEAMPRCGESKVSDESEARLDNELVAVLVAMQTAVHLGVPTVSLCIIHAHTRTAPLVHTTTHIANGLSVINKSTPLSSGIISKLIVNSVTAHRIS